MSQTSSPVLWVSGWCPGSFSAHFQASYRNVTYTSLNSHLLWTHRRESTLHCPSGAPWLSSLRSSLLTLQPFLSTPFRDIWDQDEGVHLDGATQGWLTQWCLVEQNLLKYMCHPDNTHPSSSQAWRSDEDGQQKKGSFSKCPASCGHLQLSSFICS